MAFKMKGNPMKRNFGVGKEAPHFTKQKNTNINRGDDKGNPTAAFQKSAMKHDMGQVAEQAGKSTRHMSSEMMLKHHTDEIDGHFHKPGSNVKVNVERGTAKRGKSAATFIGKTYKRLKQRLKLSVQLKKQLKKVVKEKMKQNLLLFYQHQLNRLNRLNRLK